MVTKIDLIIERDLTQEEIAMLPALLRKALGDFSRSSMHMEQAKLACDIRNGKIRINENAKYLLYQNMAGGRIYVANTRWFSITDKIDNVQRFDSPEIAFDAISGNIHDNDTWLTAVVDG